MPRTQGWSRLMVSFQVSKYRTFSSIESKFTVPYKHDERHQLHLEELFVHDKGNVDERPNSSGLA